MNGDICGGNLMKNPLRKRILRELKKDFGKYIAIFIMMVILISMCSGMRVSNESLKKAYYESYELYNLEDGHIKFDKVLPDELADKIETEGNIRFYSNMYIDEDINNTEKTIRVYKISDEVNNSCLLSGEYPSNDDEIVIDRVFAKNNELIIGDNISLGNEEYKITGLIALPQYSTLYESNTDSMFDSINFSIAEVTDNGFDKLDIKKLNYNYAWFYNKKYADDIEQAEFSDNLIEILTEIITDYDKAQIVKKGFESADIIDVKNYIPRYLNNGINFSIEDIGKDEAGTMVMCYMMIALIAFIFAVTISNTISSEAGVIGTLRASGYTRGEIISHYMVLPIIVTLFSAVVGNIIGYTFMKDFCANLYLNSYSLTTYTTVWDSSAFILSTVIPIVLMLVINLITLSNKLRLSPLKFLRRDLKKNSNKKAMRLNTKIPFKTRFSLRIFFTNLPGYIVMIVGIMFGSILIAFGDMLPRMINDVKDIVTKDLICDYQYILYDYKKSNDITDNQTEKFTMTSFDFSKEGFITDEITVYGIENESKYIPIEIPEGKALISTGISEKYGLGTGDSIVLDEKYKKDSSYTIEIAGVYDYQASLSIFMNIDDYNKKFGKEENYFTGYFSNKELNELEFENVAAVMTLSDFTKLSDQINVSMGKMMGLFKYFGALFFIIVVYVLCKQIIEKNFQSISLTKILGFKNSEIGGLYIVSTTIAVIIGLLISIPVIDFSIRAIFKNYLYTMMSGYLPCNISPITYVIMISIGIACYVAVAILQMIKVSKVSKSEALKNAE